MTHANRVGVGVVWIKLDGALEGLARLNETMDLVRSGLNPGLELEAQVRGLGVLAERGATSAVEKSFSVTIDLVG